MGGVQQPPANNGELTVDEILDDLEKKNKAKADAQRDFVSSVARPLEQVISICEGLNFEFRDRIYNPMIVVWMFVGQVLSKDKACQQAVNRFNAYRVQKGLPKASSSTTVSARGNHG
ncbi:MAG: hypothetical protein AAFP69_16970 [Planctomycetota bacterium]